MSLRSHQRRIVAVTSLAGGIALCAACGSAYSEATAPSDGGAEAEASTNAPLAEASATDAPGDGPSLDASTVSRCEILRGDSSADDDNGADLKPELSHQTSGSPPTKFVVNDDPTRWHHARVTLDQAGTGIASYARTITVDSTDVDDDPPDTSSRRAIRPSSGSAFSTAISRREALTCCSTTSSYAGG